MVKKLQKMSADKKSAPPVSSAVKDSAQQIWLAGLGAFSKAQEEGNKVFDTLVKEGLAIQRKTQAATEEKISEAASRVSDMASDLQSKAGNRWDKLETIFEDRVAKALSKLGVPSARDVAALAERIALLDQHVRALSASSTPATPSPSPTAKPVAKPARRAAAKTITQQRAAAPAAKKSARSAVRRAAATLAAASEPGNAATASDAAP